MEIISTRAGKASQLDHFKYSSIKVT